MQNSLSEQSENVQSSETPESEITVGISLFKKFKTNWSVVLGLLGGSLVFAAIIFLAYFYDKRGQEIQTVPTETPTPTPTIVVSPPLTPQTSSVTLSITKLKTTFGIEGQETPKYPNSITINVPIEYKDQLAAYGVSYEVIIGPKGWTGNGGVGADGNRSIELYPADNTWQDGSKITVFVASTGTGSAIYEAVEYFPWIQEHWEEVVRVPLPSIAPINSNFITPHLNRYSKESPGEGLEINGVAYSDAQDHLVDNMWSFTKMEITFPVKKSSFAESLLDFFIDQQGFQEKF